MRGCHGKKVEKRWYRRHSKQLNENTISLLKFKLEISHALLQCGKILTPKIERHHPLKKKELLHLDRLMMWGMTILDIGLSGTSRNKDVRTVFHVIQQQNVANASCTYAII